MVAVAPPPLARPITATRRLRVTTGGSVDDGKSTLIGRLLYDTKSLFDDHLDALERTRRRSGGEVVDLAHITDGLRAEREQGITIDVAYRYFATPRRSFVLADVPGHEQYTANMVTGASVSEVALVLVDARHGVVAQTRRHLAVAALLRLRAIVVVINKMDLVGWDPAVFDALRADVGAVLAGLGSTAPLHVVPVSARHGDNVVEASARTPWYAGEPLLEVLEHLDVASADAGVGARLPVQLVLRTPGGRALAGALTGGPLAVGDAVVALPSGLRTCVRALTVAGRDADEAAEGSAVTVTLADELDVGRGDLLATVDAPLPTVTNRLVADVCWLSDTTATAASRWILKHTTRTTPARIDSIDSALDLTTLAPHPDQRVLGRNDLGRVTLTTASPLAVDPFERCGATGRFVLIDPVSSVTAAAGIVLDRS